MYKYLKILEADTIKKMEMKQKIKKEKLSRMRKLFETKLYSKNLIKGINTWVATLIRYLGSPLTWTREELKQMDQRTRKLMILHKALHPRYYVDWLYVSRKEGGREHASIENSIEVSIQRLHRTMWRKANYRHQEQQNKQNQKTKLGRKTTLWMF